MNSSDTQQLTNHYWGCIPALKVIQAIQASGGLHLANEHLENTFTHPAQTDLSQRSDFTFAQARIFCITGTVIAVLQKPSERDHYMLVVAKNQKHCEIRAHKTEGNQNKE